jgi:rhamnosyltransferase
MKISAVTILYNPNKRAIESINSYIHQVEHIYLIDNSTQKIDSSLYQFIIDNHNKINIFSLGKNYGIAYALNKGTQLAIRDNNEWILTMDQDTIVCPYLIEQYVLFIHKHNELNIGILSPQIFLKIKVSFVN